MGKDQQDIYFFISDENNKYITAIQNSNGSFNLKRNSSPAPIRNNPKNMNSTSVEFSTNKKYMSLTRSISYPIEFIKDGASILNSLYLNGKGVNEITYLTVVKWNGTLNYYELLYKGRVDYNTRLYSPLTNIFKVSIVDDSAWGILSKNDTIQYAINCSSTNPKAIKVVVDGIILENRITYQPVDNIEISQVVNGGGFIPDAYSVVPIVLVNQDGDSFGIVLKNQVYREPHGFLQEIKDGDENFFESFYDIQNMVITGSIKYSIRKFFGGGRYSIYLYTSLGRKFSIAIEEVLVNQLSSSVKYSKNINLSISLSKNEKLFLVAEQHNNGIPASIFYISFNAANITFSLKTKPDSQVVYALRPLDLLQEIVSKATKGRYTIKSNYFSANKNLVVTCGDAIRGFQSSSIYSSFEEFFKSYDAINFLALRIINGELWIEKADEVYSQTSNIFDLGEVIDCQFEPAEDMYVNEIEVGSPKKDLRHTSGRLEFNSTNTFSLPFINVDKKMSIVSKYRTGCYDIQFLILDYKGSSTKDNEGDKSVFLLDITNNKKSSFDEIENFVSVDINNAPLAPYIRSPFNNKIISYNKPLIKGITTPNTNVYIYVDDTIDGFVASNQAGFWSYQIQAALTSYVPNVTTGIHTVKATFTDLGATFNSISLTVDTSITTPTAISYPSDGDSLFNNKPLVKGVGQAGANLVVIINGANLGTITVDNSCNFEFQTSILPNTSNTISIGSDSVTFDVNTSVAIPLITSFSEGFTEVNNLPLVEGVASPGTVVTLYSNYISYAVLGIATSDLNGNWSIQLIGTTYLMSGVPVVLAPLSNGQTIISTSLDIQSQKIGVSGFELNRPNYSSISGVLDNTVFNTEISPKRMLLNRASYFASMFFFQKREYIYFQTADKNGVLKTTLNGVSIAENSNVAASSLGSPMMIMERAIIKTKMPLNFSSILYNFNSGGLIKFSIRGTDIYTLPIGSMKMNSITSDVQNWKLMLSPVNSLSSLLNTYKNGVKINLMKNSLYHSDYNFLHFVSYNYAKDAKYNNVEMYNDWFNNRNSSWSTNPDYIQKISKVDPIVRDQIITNGISNVVIQCYDCSLAQVGSTTEGLYRTIAYNPISPAPINPPDIILEAAIDFSSFEEGQYFFVVTVGGVQVLISERVHVKETWENTILIESSNSLNKPEAFFSTGFKCIFRVEGLVDKWQPSVSTVVSDDEAGNNSLLYSLSTKKRNIRFGTAFGLPDYLYMKISNSLILDDLLVEGVAYSISKDEKIDPSDYFDGHPMFYYNVSMDIRASKRGITVGAAPGYITDSVLLVVDATAFGLPAGTLLNIELG